MDLLVDWFLKGGWIMWPLLVLSVLLVAVALERAAFHLRHRCSYRHLLHELPCAFECAKGGRKPGCLERDPDAPLRRITATYLDHLHYPRGERHKVLQREGDRILRECNAHLKLVGCIAQVAPLMGLLGTVTGLVAAFYHIQLLGGKVVPSDLAGGIWEALITTVAGLCVGIPALLVYQFFHARAERIAKQMQDLVSELDELYFCSRYRNKLSNISEGMSRVSPEGAATQTRMG
ncbi:MAG: MotA/TolQ/ExbB proton channel family protein [Verrucomicrobiota bacterium JB022]|nr:MotA/TolQ/ExbB proton channel family protein [Verrucomicrobiota bacterium JB022]